MCDHWALQRGLRVGCCVQVLTRLQGNYNVCPVAALAAGVG
jgi:hypothetical protein